MIELVLSEDEMLAGVVVAARKKITSDRRRAEGREPRRPEHYEEERSWDQEIESSFAEIAVARWRNYYWSGSYFNGTAGTDAGALQVRWTPHRGGHLLIYREDDADTPFLLVTGRSPKMTIVGWAYARDAYRSRYWKEKGEKVGGSWVKCASWWMPQRDLRGLPGPRDYPMNQQLSLT